MLFKKLRNIVIKNSDNLEMFLTPPYKIIVSTNLTTSFVLNINV